MTLDGARRLAAAMIGGDAPEAETASELSELELSAVAEAMNQMMASAAIATSAVLGTEVEIGAPTTRTFLAPSDSDDVYPITPHAVRAELSVCGRPCSLVQLIPSAFVVRMTRALDELDSEIAVADARGPPSRRRAGRRSAASPCGCGPSWDERGCRPPASSACLPARWSSSTVRPTTRSTSTSTGRASPQGASSSSTARTGR